MGVVGAESGIKPSMQQKLATPCSIAWSAILFLGAFSPVFSLRHCPKTKYAPKAYRANSSSKPDRPQEDDGYVATSPTSRKQVQSFYAPGVWVWGSDSMRSVLSVHDCEKIDLACPYANR